MVDEVSRFKEISVKINGRQSICLVGFTADLPQRQRALGRASSSKALSAIRVSPAICQHRFASDQLAGLSRCQQESQRLPSASTIQCIFVLPRRGFADRLVLIFF